MARIQQSSTTWWTLSNAGPHSYGLQLDFEANHQVRRILILADVHWDSAHCQLAALKETLAQAQAEGCPVIISGDFFDAMQGKWDPRSSQEALRPEHRGGSYLDLLVDTSSEWLAPFSENLALISYGNHETAIKKRHEVDLLQRLCHELRRGGSRVECGPYWGFVLVSGRFAMAEKQRDSFTIHYHHGFGGGGEITRGMIDQSRTRSQYLADVYVSGHIHRRNCDENVLTTVTARGVIRHRRQLFLRCSSWKNESSDGWHVQQGRAARPIGGWWLEVSAVRTPQSYQLQYKAIPT